MIAIADYGVGNIFSLYRSFEAIGADARLTDDPAVLRRADRLVLPGVGAFGDAVAKLEASGLRQTLIEEAENGKPLLGICLGMQLMLDKGFEYGEHDGLGLIPGEVTDMRRLLADRTLKIPHMGWNALEFPGSRPECPLFKYANEGDYVYFVHSFCAVKCGEHTIAVTDYSYKVTAAVAKGNIFGVQFHPEKSGRIGLDILRAFNEL